MSVDECSTRGEPLLTPPSILLDGRSPDRRRGRGLRVHFERATIAPAHDDAVVGVGPPRGDLPGGRLPGRAPGRAARDQPARRRRAGRAGRRSPRYSVSRAFAGSWSRLLRATRPATGGACVSAGGGVRPGQQIGPGGAGLAAGQAVGPDRGRSERTCRLAARSRKRYWFTIPRPPRCLPAPPLSGRKPYPRCAGDMGLDQLGRVVGEVHVTIAEASTPSCPGRAAPRAVQELEIDEGLSVGVVAAEADAGVAAGLAGRDEVVARSGPGRRRRRWRCGSRSARGRRPAPAGAG